jgi:CHAT domain-containing protein
MGSKEGEVLTYLNLADIYRKMGDSNKVLTTYNKAFQISEEIGNTLKLAQTCEKLGRYYYDQTDFLASKIYIQKSYVLAKKSNYSEILKSSSQMMKLLAMQENKLSKADEYAKDIVEIDNKSLFLNFTVLSETEQELYFKKLANEYMDFNSYALYRKNSNPELQDIVFNNTIRNKGLLLKSATAMRAAILSSKDTVLINKYESWVIQKRQISRLLMASAEEQKQELKTLEEQANNLENELVKLSSEFSDFKKIQNITWQDIQKSLNPNEAAIEFVHFKTIDYESKKLIDFEDTVLYCAIIVKPNSEHPEMIPLFTEKDLKYILGQPGDNDSRYINWLYGNNSKTKTDLYDLIWKPIEESLEGINKVYISPTGLLHKVSFAAFEKGQNVYLSDLYEIQVKTSIGQLLKDRDESLLTFQNASIFGGINYISDSTKNIIWYYLHGTKTEAENINKLFLENNLSTNYYTENTATEEEFKATARISNIVHVATHGYFYPDPKELKNDEKSDSLNSNNRGEKSGFGLWAFVNNNNPLMRSGLVFAGANDVWSIEEKTNGDDGVLTAHEVTNLDMRKTELVVMSACETGLGDIRGSEGVYGLQRAFKMAGVHYMIMSLWKVPDYETQLFMTDFYTRLLKDNNVVKAFTETQKEMRKKHDPYYWAAFVLIN